MQEFIDSVRAFLVQTDGNLPKQEIYNTFINECKKNNLEEKDFYQKVLNVANKSIDWGFIEEQKKIKEEHKQHEEEKKAKIEEELQDVQRQREQAPIFINRLVNSAFDDGVMDKEELANIFGIAEKLDQDKYALSEKINNLIDEKGFKSYPNADYKLPTLKDTLCSTNWYSKENFIKITTPPPPPPKPFPWRKFSVASFLALVLFGLIGYFAFLKPYLEDKNATRYYSLADNLAMRSTPIAGVDYNSVQALNYGSEILVYNKENNWAYGKSKGIKGYVSLDYILPKKDFYELNGIFGDSETKQGISTAKCRKALLYYFQDSINRKIMGKIDPEIQKEIYGKVKTLDVWQVFSKGKDKYPDAIFFPRFYNPNSKYSDFACIIKNLNTNQRKFLLFTFSDKGEPKLINEQDAPSTGDILKISDSFINGERTPMVSYTTQ